MFKFHYPKPAPGALKENKLDAEEEEKEDVADTEEKECRVCKVRGCEECENDQKDDCKICEPLFVLNPDGKKCDSAFGYVFWTVVAIVAAVFVYIAAF